MRDPLKCIATCIWLWIEPGNIFAAKASDQIKRSDFSALRKNVGLLEFKAEKKAEITYRVEAIKSVLPELNERLGVKLDLDKVKSVSTLRIQQNMITR